MEVVRKHIRDPPVASAIPPVAAGPWRPKKWQNYFFLVSEQSKIIVIFVLYPDVEVSMHFTQCIMTDTTSFFMVTKLTSEFN